jgi:N utilization substance protein B
MSGAQKTSKQPPKGPAKGSRSAARLGAVQALYQSEISDIAPSMVISEFLDHRLGKELEGDRYKAADKVFFGDIVEGVFEQAEAIDRQIAGSLPANWPLERLENLVRAILRCGVYELTARPDVPTAVIINEYVDVAHAFYAEGEPAFVNGVLDNVARRARPGA